MRLLVLCPALLSLLAVHAQPGSPDPTFGGDGTVVVDIGNGSNDQAHDVAFQTDGKAVMVGYTGTSNQDFCVVRLHPDGTLDNSFGGDGKVTTEVNGVSDRARSVAIQADGRIVVAGHVVAGGGYDIALVRYHPDGTLDNGFSADGKLTIDVDGDDLALSVVVQPDGRILAAGRSESTDHERFTLVRLLEDGTPDPAFGNGGIAQAAFLPEDDATGWDIALQPDGKVVMVGHASDGTYQQFAMARFNADGTLDADFGSGGTATFGLGIADDIARAVALQLDGGIVVTGYTSDGINEQYLAIRLLANGILDPSFGSTGSVALPVTGHDTPHGVVVQPDGRIVLAGYSHTGIQRVFSSVRLNVDGSPDNTYDSDGMLLLPVGSVEDRCFNLTLAPNGRLAMVGYSDGSNSTDFALAMVLSGLSMGVEDPGTHAVVMTASPNPVIDRTTLILDLPRAMHLDARLLDAQGRAVRSICERCPFPAGQNRMPLDLTGLAAGPYTAVVLATSEPVAVLRLFKR